MIGTMSQRGLSELKNHLAQLEGCSLGGPSPESPIPRASGFNPGWVSGDGFMGVCGVFPDALDMNLPSSISSLQIPRILQNWGIFDES